MLLQEHWLTPANMSTFDSHFVNCFSFGKSAMIDSVSSGMLRGRPYGGVITLIRNDLRKYVETVYCDDRYVVVRVANYLLINVYLPCIGTPGRLLICEDIIMNISLWCERYTDCKVVVDLANSSDATLLTV